MSKTKGKRPVKLKPAQDEREARVMEAARRAYRLAKDKLHEARDPASSKEASEAVWAATDEVGQTIVESVEGKEAEAAIDRPKPSSNRSTQTGSVTREAAIDRPKPGQ